LKPVIFKKYNTDGENVLSKFGDVHGNAYTERITACLHLYMNQVVQSAIVTLHDMVSSRGNQQTTTTAEFERVAVNVSPSQLVRTRYDLGHG